MTAQPGRSRRQRIDVRLVIGVVLVVASVVGVWGLVRSFDHTVDVYVSPTTLVIGDTVRASDLEHRAVHLGDLTSAYAVVGSLPDGELTMAREVAEGELIPARAMTSTQARTHTRVVLTVPGPVSDLVRGGTRVDVWAAKAAERNSYDDPQRVAEGILAVRLIEADGFMAQQDQVSLEVQVDKDTAGTLIEAMVRGDLLTVVPSVLTGEAPEGAAGGDEDSTDAADADDRPAEESDEGESGGADR